MDVLDAQAVADAFPQDGAGGAIAQLGPIFDSNGGYYNVSGAGVYAQYAYGRYGEYYWSEPVPIPVGPAILEPGTVGVRFKNYTPGSPATVSGALSEKGEPAVQITSGGVASSSTGSGSMRLVQEIGPLAVAQASFDFTGIPASFAGGTILGRHLLIVGQFRSTNASPSQLIECQLNGDAGANYDYHEFFNRTAAAGSRTGAGAGFLVVGECAAALDAAGSASPLEIEFPNYALNTLRKNFRSKGFAKNNGDADATNFMLIDAGGEWRNAAPITEVRLFQPAGNFDVGSFASLYVLTNV